MRIGVSSVPTLLFDITYLAVGARTTQELHEVLRHAWTNSSPEVMDEDQNAEFIDSSDAKPARTAAAAR
jgi:predicted DsbA family dithiol-disulfide isomerase